MKWIPISPPINSPLVRYEKEWMSIYDFISLKGATPDRKVLNSIDLVFMNESLHGEDQFFMITAIRYDDSVWLTNFRRYDSPAVSPSEIRTYLRMMDTDNPKYTFYLGRCETYKRLTQSAYLKVMNLTRSFRNLEFYEF